MHVNELVLEITRRCNIECRHCLRGKAQAVSMSKETMHKALRDITSIGTVTFTGGEPSLAVNLIRYFEECIRWQRFRVDSFFVITNGKIASTFLKGALRELQGWCDNPDNCSLIISEDQFHRELGYDQRRAINLYSDLPFFHYGARRHPIETPIYEGLAIDNGVGQKSPYYQPLILGEDEDGNVVHQEGVIYINALGDVCPSCDMSYLTQSMEKLGNVNEEPLPKILARQLKLAEVA